MASTIMPEASYKFKNIFGIGAWYYKRGNIKGISKDNKAYAAGR